MTGADAPEVAVEHLRASYDRRVLTDVTFTVAPGTTTVLSGPAGCGKTAVVRILLGRLTPDRGAATIDGRSVVGAGAGELADVHRHTRFLFSGLDAGARGRKGFDRGGGVDPDDGVVGSATVADNVRSALADSAGDDRLARCLADFDLTDDEQRRAKDLDVGARRRLGLARVFAADPTLVLLDDPVAALAPADRDAVVAALGRARATSAATIILTCNDLTTTKAVADHLVALVAGRVRSQGPAGRLLRFIDTDQDYAIHFVLGGGRAMSGSASDALAEHRKLVGFLGYDQRLALGLIAVVGVLCLVSIVVLLVIG